MDIKILASSSSGNCYYVSDGVSSLLLECGIRLSAIKQGLGFAISKLSGCLVTHEHQDHAKSVSDMIGIGVDVYLTAGTADEINLSRHHRLHYVKSMQSIDIGTFRVLPFAVNHDAVEPVGYLVCSKATGERLLFVTDTYYVEYRFEGAIDYVLVECNYSLDIVNRNVENGLLPAEHKSRLMRSHFELSNVKRFLQAQNLNVTREIWLLHLSDGNSDEERFRREIMAATGCAVYVAPKNGIDKPKLHFRSSGNYEKV